MKHLTLIALILALFGFSNTILASGHPPVEDPPATAVWNLAVASTWGEGNPGIDPDAAGVLYLRMGIVTESSIPLQQGTSWSVTITDTYPFLTRMESVLETCVQCVEVFPDGGSEVSSIETDISVGTHTHKWMYMSGSSSSD